MFKFLTILNTRQAIEALPTLSPLIDRGKNRYIIIQEVSLTLQRRMFNDMVDMLTPMGGRSHVTTIEAMGRDGKEMKFLVGFVESKYDGSKI